MPHLRNKRSPHGLLQTLTAAAVLTLLPPPHPVLAAAALEEVVVTARKRQESLQETPIAITAFSADALREGQINNISDLTNNVPGLTRQEGDKRANLSIRGIGTRLSQITADPGVGVYIDSIYMPRNDSQLVDVLNMESVQVLRGPQGTLFGKNTAGGAILLTTKKPSETFEGFASVNLGDRSRQFFRFGVSGPIWQDTLSGGIQLDHRKEDGYRDDAFTGQDYGDIDRKSALGQLRYQSGVLTADLMYFYGKVEEHTSPVNCFLVQRTQLQAFTAPGQSAGYGELCERSESLLDDEKVIMDRSPLVYEITSQLGGATLAWDLKDFTVRSITGYLYQDDIDLASQDIDGTDLYTLNNAYEYRRQLAGNGIASDDETRKFFSQEFQLLGDAFDEFLEYTVGLYYSNEKIDNNPGGNMIGPGGWLGLTLPDGNVSLSPPFISFREAIIRDFENTSAAAFGQAILNLSETWQLTVGGRFHWEEKKAAQVNYSSDSDLALGPSLTRADFDALQNYLHPIIIDPEIPGDEGKEDWTEFNPAATLTMFAPDAWYGETFNGGIFYASAKNGFKAGGFSPFGDQFLPFDPEEVWTYELGYKLDFLSSKLRLNGALYYSDYDDIQINVTRNFPDPNGIDRTENGIANAGKATLKGGELELSAMPVDGLLLNASASYTDAEYDEFKDLAPQLDGSQLVIDRSDEDFAYIPKWTWSLIAQYEWQTEFGAITPRIHGYYMGSVFIGLDPASAQTPEAYVDSYKVWNFRLAFQPLALENVELAAYVNNFTDENYFGSGVASIEGVGSVTLRPGRQRSYGIELYYTW